MKKLLIIVASSVVAVCANAASFNWQAANLYGSDPASKWTGEVKLYAVIDSVNTLVSTATASSTGLVSKNDTTFNNDNLVAGNLYDFFFTIEDGGKKFTSDVKQATAQATATITVNFGNMQTATQNASNWQAVPEPTSGLLMLLGVAGLALRRRRA